MAARHAEGQKTHEVCWPPQWVSDSLTVWIWVQQIVFFWPCRGLEEGVSALAALLTPCKLWWCDLTEALWGADQFQWTVRVYKRWSPRSRLPASVEFSIKLVCVYKRWSVRNTALEMIYIDGHSVGGWRRGTCTNVMCSCTFTDKIT